MPQLEYIPGPAERVLSVCSESMKSWKHAYLKGRALKKVARLIEQSDALIAHNVKSGDERHIELARQYRNTVEGFCQGDSTKLVELQAEAPRTVVFDERLHAEPDARVAKVVFGVIAGIILLVVIGAASAMVTLGYHGMLRVFGAS